VRIQIIAFGKLKTPGLREAADYYKKLIHPWAALEEVELKPVAVPDKSEATRQRVQPQEAELLLARLPERSALYLLDEAGRALSTRQWAEQARDWERECPHVTLAIGSSLGFDESLRRRAKATLSLGAQTLPHELARVVLLEQLYRAWSVLRGHPYHNEGA